MLTPLTLVPDLHRRPWGGVALSPRFQGRARRLPGSEPFGEAWLAGPESIVDDGSGTGRPLADLVARHGAALVGTAAWRRYAGVPLLIKLLDAAQPLSVQVHPDDAYARTHAASVGKAEAWWVLDAAPGAQVTWGLAAPTTREAFAAAARAGRLAPLLRTLDVHAGDVIVNPPGTVHALGAGLLVYEVQQPSDVTYRLDDHGRVGADGRPRALHLDDGVAVADLTPGCPPTDSPHDHPPGRRPLARTPEFVLEAIDAATPGGVAWSVGVGSCEFLTHVGAPGERATLLHATGRYELAPSATLLLPAGSGAVRVEGAGYVARALHPD